MVSQARAWCHGGNVEPDGWNLYYTAETCYVRFAQKTNAVLLIIAVGGSYRMQPTPRATRPDTSRLAAARLARAAREQAKQDAAWARRAKRDAGTG